ncbi:MAG: hypothetical protein HQK53_01890 [Oligoflexia bacterium]|nr:hypothetical protein [Oligoflexia bacterium]
MNFRLNLFRNFEELDLKIRDLSNKVARLEIHIEKKLAVQKTNLIRIKNKEEITESFIFSGLVYNDLSPTLAYKIYQDRSKNFILVDVSKIDFIPPLELQGALRIPLEELEKKYQLIQSKTVPILFISENGIRSILACEIMAYNGYYNTNNISGGYSSWPKSS